MNYEMLNELQDLVQELEDLYNQGIHGNLSFKECMEKYEIEYDIRYLDFNGILNNLDEESVIYAIKDIYKLKNLRDKFEKETDINVDIYYDNDNFKILSFHDILRKFEESLDKVKDLYNKTINGVISLKEALYAFSRFESLVNGYKWDYSYRFRTTVGYDIYISFGTREEANYLLEICYGIVEVCTCFVGDEADKLMVDDIREYIENWL